MRLYGVSQSWPTEAGDTPQEICGRGFNDHTTHNDGDDDSRKGDSDVVDFAFGDK